MSRREVIYLCVEEGKEDRIEERAKLLLIDDKIEERGDFEKI